MEFFVKTPIFWPVSVDVDMLVHAHFVLLTVEGGTSQFSGPRHVPLDVRTLRESLPLRHISFSLFGEDSLRDSPDNVCSMAQVIAKLSRQQHLPVFYGGSDVTLQNYFAMVGVFLKHWWNMAARSGSAVCFCERV